LPYVEWLLFYLENQKALLLLTLSLMFETYTDRDHDSHCAERRRAALSLHFATLRRITLCYAEQRCTTLSLHAAAIRHAVLHCAVLRCAALRCAFSALRCDASCCTALHCVALRYVALRCAALCWLCCVAFLQMQFVTLRVAIVNRYCHCKVYLFILYHDLALTSTTRTALALTTARVLN
jgi:hypothetical protein